MRFNGVLTRAALLVGIGLILVSAIQFTGNIDDVHAERRGCERLDETRAGLYDLQGLVIQASRARLKVEPDLELRRVTRENVERYEAAQRRLVDSVAEFAVEPGSIDIDCSEAYPYPFPISLFT